MESDKPLSTETKKFILKMLSRDEYQFFFIAAEYNRGIQPYNHRRWQDTTALRIPVMIDADSTYTW